MASLAELEDALKNADAAGDTNAAKILADEILKIEGSLKSATPATNPALPSSPDGVPTTADILGLDPNIKKRGTLLPLGLDNEGKTKLATPEIALDVMNAILLPGRVLKGHTPTDKELLNFTGAFPGAAPQNALQALKAVPGKATEQAGTQAAKEATKAAERELDAAVTSTGQPPGSPSVPDLQAEARRARFAEQGIPATKGDISQDFAQQATESRLQSMATGADGEPLRQLKLEQSEAFIGKVNELVDSLGVPKNTGDSVKAALSGRIDLLRKEKNALYKEVAETAPDILNTPLITDDIILALPDVQTTRRLSKLAPGPVNAVNDLLIEFGLNTSDEAVKAFIKSGGEVTPLTLGNFDDFRIALGQIDRADQTGAVKVITGKIREALDQEAVFIDDAIKRTGVTDQSVVATLNAARARVREMKTEFSPQAISGKLTNTKRDGVTPVIEASKVSSELLGHNAPIENLQRVLKNLSVAGRKGKVARQDLQASVIADALEAALKAPSRKTSGVETVGGNQFAKALDKFGDDKLDLLFKDNPRALRELRALRQTGLDLSPTASAVPKGSAPVIMDIINRASRLPGLAAIRDTVLFVVKAGGDERAVRKAMNTAPKSIRRTAVTIKRRYPLLAERLGIVTALGVESEPSSPTSIMDSFKEDLVQPEEVI